jgi:hypothetical protein
MSDGAYSPAQKMLFGTGSANLHDVPVFRELALLQADDVLRNP